MSLVPLEPHMLAAVVTSLEMTARPAPRPLPPSPFRLVRWHAPALPTYRALFRRVGEPWLWFSRLVMSDADLAAIVHDPAVEIFAVADRRGLEIGMLELDCREPRTCELAFLGLIPELAGKGHGPWLLASALGLAWRPGVERVWVHTCTLDHPAALPAYRKAGFVPYSRAIETFADPRVAGIIAREAAPQVALLAAS
ncbi:MAG: GNAT family N-acetyltransferase [Sphingomonadaceae bacterium]|nr:GNAT family N-acetyltransferase [Sphingomonadaceae bacterium]